MTSATEGSSSQAVIAGPSAVRNMRAPRDVASDRLDCIATPVPTVLIAIRDPSVGMSRKGMSRGDATTQTIASNDGEDKLAIGGSALASYQGLRSGRPQIAERWRPDLWLFTGDAPWATIDDHLTWLP
jgi:hypothetical protein